MQQAQLITLSKTQEFFNYKAESFTYTQNFERELAYGISTERYMIQQAVGVGKPFSFELKSKQMDYIAKVYLEIQLPQVRVPVESNPALYDCKFGWCPNIGNALVKDMSFKLGGVIVIQKMTGMCVQLLHELLYPYGKMQLYDRLVGNDSYLTKVDSPNRNPDYNGVIKSQRTILVNLPFSFCLSPEDALPILVFTNIMATIELEFIDDIRTVCMYNSLMKQYVESINFNNAAILLHGVAVIPKYRTLMTERAKYPYLFKEIECKSVVSPGEEPTIKFNQASNNSVIESYWGCVQSGSYNIGKKFLVFKSGHSNDSWKDGLDEAANRLARSMVRLVPISQNPANDVNLLPREWFGSQNTNVLSSNVVLLDPALGYVTRPVNQYTYGLGDQYLRVRVPPQLLTLYNVYVCFTTLVPKINTNSSFAFNNKISELTVDGFVDSNNVLQSLRVTASKHRINLRDVSVPIDDCVDYRPAADTVHDLHVNNPFNTGALIDGSSHLITSLKYNINGWNHEEPNHETHSAAQFMSVFHDKAPVRPSLFVIPFSGRIDSRVWPDSSADLSRLESTELILKIDDPTEDYYPDTPYYLFNSDFRDRGCNISTFCTYVKYPIDIIKGVTEYISADKIRDTINDMIRLKSKFRIETNAVAP
jgi:hypothetical protein